MPWELFWNDDPWITVFYREKHNLEREAKNEMLWLQGLYDHRAVGSAIASKVWGKKDPYPDKPIRITPMSEAEKRIEAINARRKAVRFFSNMEKQWKAKETAKNVHGT
jgi:hypothetical protein